MCFGPPASEAMNGRPIVVSCVVESSHLAFSAASLKALEGEAVLAQVDTRLDEEVCEEPVHDGPVEVLSAEVGVARGRKDLEHSLVDLEDGNIERAAAEVVDGDRLVLPAPLEAVGERSRRRLVDDRRTSRPATRPSPSPAASRQ
jgi:hypothetical protein